MIFLRPELLFLFLLWAPFCYWLLQQRAVHRSWESIIDSQLLSALVNPSQPKKAYKQWLFPASLALVIIASSGPAITQQQAETASQGNLVVVLDNSLSMAATDINPSRIERAKRMINDWANSGLYQQTGIIVYSASAHWLTPFTSDARTLQLQLEQVTPFIMPEFGNHPERAFALLNDRLAELPNVPLHLLWLTDDIPSNKVSVIQRALPNFASAFVVAVGDSTATPIPLPNNQGFLTTTSNNVVMVATNQLEINRAANQLGLRTAALNSQPSALPVSELARITIDQTSHTEVGYWLVLPLVVWLFFYLARNAKSTLSLGLVVGFTALLSPPAGAETVWDKLRFNTEQRAFKALIDQQPETALTLSERSDIRGEALFQLNEYDQAAQAFAQGTEASQWFNRGNALAQQQQFEQAIAAYEQAIALAEHTGAKTNKRLIEAFLQQNPDQQESSDGDQQQDQQQNSDEDAQQGEPSNSSENSAPENEQQQPQSGPEHEDNAENNDEPASEQEPSEENNETMQPDVNRDEIREQQAIDALLNRVQTEPGRVIQQKFNYQFQQNPVDSEGTPW